MPMADADGFDSCTHEPNALQVAAFCVHQPFSILVLAPCAPGVLVCRESCSSLRGATLHKSVTTQVRYLLGGGGPSSL